MGLLAAARSDKRAKRAIVLAAVLLGAAVLALLVPARPSTGMPAATGTPSPSKSGPQQPRQAVPVQLSNKEVLIGAYISNIQTVDPATNSWLGDFYVWYRWKNPKLRPWKTVEVMNWHEAWQMMELGHQKKPTRQPDGSWYYAQRYSGAFNSPLSLVKFPFGVQQLQVIMEDFTYELGRMRFVADTRSTAIDPTITLPGYNVGDPTMTISEFSYGTDFGDLDGTSTEIYSRATLTTPVSNPGLPNVIKYLLPIVLIVGAASLVFYLPPTEVEGRIALGITALLTLVAMEWSATESLPTVAYLTMLDVLYIVGTVFILASLILGIRTSWMARDRSEATAIHSDERMLYVFLGGFAAVFGAVIVYYLVF